MQKTKDYKVLNARHFIKVTQELIEEEGVDNISIRKIADRAGYHNSTIYLYFENAAQLVLLASINYFTDYKKELAERSDMEGSPKEKFLAIWDAFGKSVFKHPQVFYNFFFGKYANNLTFIISQYYELFPEEKPVYSKDIETMYFGNSITERCYTILSPLIGTEEVRFNNENVDMVNTIIVSCFKQLLMEECSSPSPDPDIPNRQLTEMIKYITGIE